MATDSMGQRIRKKDFYARTKGFTTMKCFPGVKAPRLEHYILPDLIEHQPQTLAVHVGTNSILDREKTPEEISEEILSIGETAEEYGVENVIVSSLIVRRSGHHAEEKRRKVNEILREKCEARNYLFVSNNNISPRDISDDRVHLLNSGSAKFAKNLIDAVNRFY